MIRIDVPWDPEPASRNRLDGRHWGRKHSFSEAGQKAAGWAWVAAGRPHAEGRVRVTIIVHRESWMDHDNAHSGCKPVTDGLFKHAITPNDSPRWIEAVTITQRLTSGPPHVVFEVEEIP